MSFGGGSKKKVKAKNTLKRDTLANTTGANFNTSFGSGSSNSVRGSNGRLSIDTKTNLSKPLASVNQSAQTGLKSNLDFLQNNPAEQLGRFRAGDNPLYNLMKTEQDRNLRATLGRARLDSALGGQANSTTAGQREGTVINDDNVRRDSLLLQALNNENQTARQNAQLNLGTVGSLAGLESQLGQMPNANLLQALATRSAVLRADADRQFQADSLNAQMGSSGSSMGSTIGSLAGTALGLGLAPFTGGGSLALAGLGGSVGGGLGSFFNKPASGGMVSAPVMPSTPIPQLGASYSSASMPDFGNFGTFGSDYSMAVT